MWSGACTVRNRSPLDVVCDAGPIIHLHELDCLDLLNDFRPVLVPEQVREEVERHRPGALSHSRFGAEQVRVDISDEPEFQALVRTLVLDVGEQAALSLMARHPHAILLTDDAAARLAAEGLGYRVHGTIGVLLRAIRRQQRTPVEVLAILSDLPTSSSLHIRPGLLQEILARVEDEVAAR